MSIKDDQKAHNSQQEREEEEELDLTKEESQDQNKEKEEDQIVFMDPKKLSSLEELELNLPQILLKIEEISNKDSGTKNPYYYLYQAKEIIESLQNQVSNLTNDSEKEKKLQGVLKYYLGVNYYNTDEPRTDEILQEAIDLLGIRESEWVEEKYPSEYTVELLDTLNYLGMLWFSRTDFKKAENFFLNAEHIYRQHQNELSEKQSKALEEKYTMTIFFLAQAYTNLGNPSKGAEYCTRTLKRQLDGFQLNIKEWVDNSMQLSAYYMNEKYFANAEYCLKASQRMAESYPSHIDEFAKANLELSWGKLYLAVLEQNMYRSLVTDLRSRGESTEHLEFQPVDNELQISFDLEIDSDCISYQEFDSFESALEYFHRAKTHFDEAITYFALDGHVSEHITILQDISMLYKCLAYFEKDIDRKCSMLNRRVDLYSDVIEDLNTNIYISTIRALSYEMGETLNEMVDLRLAQKEINNTKAHDGKINFSAKKSIREFDRFMKTFTSKDGTINAEGDDLRLLLRSCLYAARLYTKIICGGKKKVEYMRKSLNQYRTIVSVADRMGVPEEFENEINMCREMIELMPTRIAELESMIN
eukprot:gb/GECH01014033.1/.p1 GENE.gb/GECH01014033.1/~~gb/GECH01014033.1/.p1  ORF type:complete len:588 (+),score=159.02 gb/GECH01014033.1/:1-1764(+)